MAAGVGGAALGRAALAAPLVLLYYCFSIGITFYNKWLMKSFPFPLLVTLLHLVLIFGLSALARALARCRSGRPRAELSWADCLRRAAPAALSTSLDIGLSNWSFLYVTVSLYTMTKSSAILFILLFSLLFKLEEMAAGHRETTVRGPQLCSPARGHSAAAIPLSCTSSACLLPLLEERMIHYSPQPADPSGVRSTTD